VMWHALSRGLSFWVSTLFHVGFLIDTLARFHEVECLFALTRYWDLGYYSIMTRL